MSRVHVPKWCIHWPSSTSFMYRYIGANVYAIWVHGPLGQGRSFGSKGFQVSIVIGALRRVGDYASLNRPY